MSISPKRLKENDIQPIIEQLQQGEILGDRIPKIGYEVFKLRVRNSDIKKGKSGGYRLIYYVKTPKGIILLTIYSKSNQADITADDIQSIIAEYESIFDLDWVESNLLAEQ